MIHYKRKLVELLASAAVAVSVPAMAMAQGPAAPKQSFNIPAQDLGKSLTDLAQQSSREIYFPSDLTRGKRSPGITGELTVDEALTRLLAGTGLTYRLNDTGAITVESAVGNGVASTEDTSVASKETAEEVESGDAEEIVVTGTNISGVKPVGVEATVITREEAEKTGHTTAGELLRTLPQVRTGGFDREGGASTISLQNAMGSNSVSLRGIGSTSNTTLLLVDGHRSVSTGANTSTVDVNQVPIAALERVEVMADGGSAVYGSDAIGGVINYILRKDYNGGEVSFRANNTFGGDEFGISATGGTHWNVGSLGRGNILVTYDYAHRDPYLAGQNPYLRFDLSPLGGVDRRINGSSATVGFVPSIVVTPPNESNPPPNTTLPRAGASVYWGLPVGPNVGLSASSLLLNQPALTDFSDYSDYLGKQKRHQATVYLNQEIGESVELFVQGRYTDRETLTRSTETVSGSRTVTLRAKLRDPNNPSASLATDNPFYIRNIPGVAQFQTITIPGFPFPIPIPGSPPSDVTVIYPALKDFGPRSYRGSDESLTVTGGVRVKLPSNWQAEASYTIGRNEGCTYCVIDSYINPVAFQYQVDIGAINPLSTEPLSSDMLAKISGTQKQIGHNGIDDLVVKFNGPLFSLPGGTVRAAFGGERNKVFNWNENTSVDGFQNLPTVLTDKSNSYFSRTIWSGFGELYVPLVGEEMNVPLIKRFVTSAALRYDEYSDAGGSTNPKLGFDWEVNDVLSFGGTWGKSFRAPSTTDVNPGAYVSGTLLPLLQPIARRDTRIDALCGSIIFPTSCFSILGWLLGSNPDLRPEKATNWSLTAKLDPGGGFKASATYYNIKFKDRLTFPAAIGVVYNGIDPGSDPLNPTYEGYESYIIPIHNPATCVNTDISTADPALLPFIQTPIYSAGSGVAQLGGFANFCAIQTLVDSRFFNLASNTSDGMDFNVSWDRQVGDVLLNAAATVNVILSFKEKVTDDTPSRDRLGISPVVKWRGRGNVSAYWKGASATLFANYYGSFINDEFVDSLGQPIFDAQGNRQIQKVPSYTTFDLNLGYEFGVDNRAAGPLKHVRTSFTIQNFFDSRPPKTFTNNSVINSQIHGIPFGRTFAFQITGAF